MRNIATFCIERPLYPTLLILACLLGGIYGIETVGRLEDPAYPFHYVLIVTEYPGASAVEVEQEVTDVLEAAVRELPYIEEIVSKSVPGRSEVQVEFKDEYDAQEAQQIFDELRRRVGDAVGKLPPAPASPWSTTTSGMSSASCTPSRRPAMTPPRFRTWPEALSPR